MNGEISNWGISRGQELISGRPSMHSTGRLMRTSVGLRPDQEAALAKVKGRLERTGAVVSFSGMIRDAIDLWLKEKGLMEETP